jgi:allantoin racemase
VDIPVIGPGETGVHYASLLGNSFGVVTLKEEGFLQAWRDVIYNSGLQTKAIANPVRGVSMSSYDVATKGIADVSLIVHAVEERARELVKDGAEVVVVGCSLFSPLCTAAGLVNLDGNVPIVDVMAVSLKMAEFMVDLKNSIGLPVLSRAGRYQVLPDKDIRRLGAHFGVDKQST